MDKIINRIEEADVLDAMKEMGEAHPESQHEYVVNYNGHVYAVKQLLPVAIKYASGTPFNFPLADELYIQGSKWLIQLGFKVQSQQVLPLTAPLFARQFFDYLCLLPENEFIGEWLFKGETDIAYNTPLGPWEHTGFLLEAANERYSFIIRSIWDAGQNRNVSYLVVESNNLRGQLGNIALYMSEKFSNENGLVTIYETYDMTVGYGRRARDEVRKAFRAVGFTDDIITQFNEEDIFWPKVVSDILRWAMYREEAKKILLAKDDEEPEDNGTQDEIESWQAPMNYWFIRYPTNELPIEDGVINYPNEYPIGPKAGEKGIFWDGQGVFFLFEGTDSPSVLKVAKVCGANIRINSRLRKFKFASELRLVNGMLPLTEAEYLDTVKALEAAMQNVSKSFIPDVFSDSAENDIKDQLDVISDVNALAAVMAYRKVTPPLAIGLFGNWGSGKSFFMNKLQQKIEELQDDKSDVFCKEVLQINFNSWHYSDANLWASLITKIFEELRAYGNKGKADEFTELLQKLNSTKEMLQEKQAQKQEIDDQIKRLEEHKEAFENDVKKQIQKLGSLSRAEILIDLWNSNPVKEEVEQVKQKYSFLHIDGLDDIEKNVKELNSFGKRAIRSLRVLPEFMKAPRPWCMLMLVIAVAVIAWLLVENSELVKKYMNVYTVFVIKTVALLSVIVQALGPTMKIVEKAHKKLQSLKVQLDKLKERAAEKFTAQREELLMKISDAQAASHEQQQKIDLLTAEQQKLTQDISDIKSGKKIIKFIEDRVNDQRYISSLGIISWVRKDFEELNNLLRQQKDSRSRNEGESEPTSFELERIILYIDDLDRCNEETVVKVLEAIHLLLAFPLFVVVVGVDPRWMHNALNEQYGKLLGSPQQNGDLNKIASSYDYLEKIFQIPFVLKPMEDSGKHKLIRSQFEGNGISKLASPAPVLSSAEQPAEAAAPAAEPGLAAKPSFTHSGIVEKSGLTVPSDTIKPETLQVSNKEINFIQQLSFLIGDSPRTIKRYTNIYRIIRTHSHFERDNEEEMNSYLAVMIMLGVITGISEKVKGFFESIEQADNNQDFAEYLTAYLSKESKGSNALQQLHTRLGGNNSPLKQLGAIKMSNFKNNLELVGRFSFHNVY